MSSPTGAQIDYARPGVKFARNVPAWPALIINLPVPVLLLILITKPAGFWMRNRWISEDRVWYAVSAVSVLSAAWALLALYVSRRHFSRWRAKWAAGAIVLALLNMRMAESLYPTGIHKHYNLNVCMKNLWSVGLQIRIYANAHAGRYPDNFEAMTLDEDFPDASLLTCPVSGDALIPGTDREAIAAALAKPGHVSYLYFGRNLNAKTTPPSTLIACDKPHNHDGPDYDCCALFADGSVRLIPRGQLARLIAQQVPATAPSGVNNANRMIPHSPGGLTRREHTSSRRGCSVSDGRIQRRRSAQNLIDVCCLEH